MAHLRWDTCEQDCCCILWIMKFNLFCRWEGDHGCLGFLIVELAILLKKLDQWWIISTIWVMHSFGKKALSKSNVMGLQVSILRRSFAVLEFKGNNSGLQECFYLISDTNNVASCFCHMHLPSVVDTANCRLIGAWCCHNFGKIYASCIDIVQVFLQNQQSQCHK